VGVESWSVEFGQDDGTTGVMRLELHRADGRSSFLAELVVPDRGVYVVRDDEVPLPRGRALEVRADSLWAEMVCETPSVHWSFGLEAFGLRFDDLEEARTADWGERVAVGLDLEWEATNTVVQDAVGEGYRQDGVVHGELLLGPARVSLDGTGVFAHTPT